ncbi:MULTISPECIES: 3-deoxy-D-manno-octulosonic acid kinase [Pseudoalteromonas]|uniref:3-deoxy-D-manno-octulosonic acid kinase n=1 Tax=Pseudoalteromonas TaxID=53246 RepID=UPI000FFF5F42|nr:MULTISPECIES: 3-deoxy-D-manno-octulosonic acid kinase [Pseudoalteromonas]NKC19749.1 3-deoxy-D-manno-octulosonic acid kinase [Pseudoalteromonas galatheae]RXE86902.1 3-deoxy-D-manno-octulosonic acid kinase [Pseudoalteromonas sp. A757]
MQITKQPHSYLLTPSALDYDISEEMFNPEYWQKNNAIVGSKEGRATAWFVRFNQGIAVLKHYYRGGLIGKLLSDQYIFTKLENTRVYQEFALLEQLQLMGLPVPTPLGARISLHFGIYRADILTEAVPEATSVCEVLQARALSANELESIGHTIAQFHRAGAYHDDLNINNILFDANGKVFLIDFDKGKIMQPNSSWQHANMERLQRSFKKEAGKWPTFYFDENQWQVLMQAYRSAR